MIRYTRYSLKKLEKLFSELDYTIRYERGNFQSGYCIVEQRNIAVINKFYDTEGRINVLLEILASLSVDPKQLEAASAKFYQQIESDLPDTSEEE
jgi:hypothetical protein